jgi:hypothetical protein
MAGDHRDRFGVGFGSAEKLQQRDLLQPRVFEAGFQQSRLSFLEQFPDQCSGSPAGQDQLVAQRRIRQSLLDLPLGGQRWSRDAGEGEIEQFEEVEVRQNVETTRWGAGVWPAPAEGDDSVRRVRVETARAVLRRSRRLSRATGGLHRVGSSGRTQNLGWGPA